MGALEPTNGAGGADGFCWAIGSVRLAGDYDETNCDRLRRDLEAALGRHIQVDCSAVTYLGSAGLSVILDVRQQAVDAGASLVITAPSTIVRALLAATDLTDTLVHPEHR